MRFKPVSILAGSALALLVLVGSTGAALASPPTEEAATASGASRETYDLADAWCFDDVVLQYCTEVEGRFQVISTPNGREAAKVPLLERVTVYRDGVEIGSYDTRTHDRTVFLDGGILSMHIGERTTATYDGQTCVTLADFRMVDDEVVLDRFGPTRCH
jgi:hypothetical protein